MIDLSNMDMDELIAEFSNQLEITITEDYNNPDLSISTWSTADGYDLYVMMNGCSHRDIIWETDVYYYEIPSEDIIERIVECGEGSEIYLDDLDHLKDWDLIAYLEDNYPEIYCDGEDEA